MATTITISPTSAHDTTTLVNLVTQVKMLENVGGAPPNTALLNARRNLLRAMELWPASRC